MHVIASDITDPKVVGYHSAHFAFLAGKCNKTFHVYDCCSIPNVPQRLEPALSLAYNGVSYHENCHGSIATSCSK